MMATFMAKWSKDWPGQSGHIHMSLQEQGTASRHSTTPASRTTCRDDDALVRRRPAEADAGAAGHGGPDGEQLFAPDPGFLGADLGDLGRREPHHARCASSRAAAKSSASSTGSRRPTSIPTSRSRRRSAPASGASRTRSSRMPMVEGNAYDAEIPGQRASCRARLTEAAERLKKIEGRRATLFGDDFVEHFAASREWEEREFRRPSPTGNWRATSRSSDDHHHRHIDPEDHQPGRWVASMSSAAGARQDEINAALSRGAARAARVAQCRRSPSAPRSLTRFCDAFEQRGARDRRRAHLADGPADPLRARAKCAARSSAPAT